MLETKAVQTITTWKGKDIEKMGADELRIALKELGELYTEAVNSNIRRSREFRGYPVFPGNYTEALKS
jgi:hypothetical protein